VRKLRAQALSSVSHRTLLRGPGPLGTWSLNPAIAKHKQHAAYELRQTAIIAAGIVLGVVRKTATGFEVL
jgi:hypothetical protein